MKSNHKVHLGFHSAVLMLLSSFKTWLGMSFCAKWIKGTSTFFDIKKGRTFQGVELIFHTSIKAQNRPYGFVPHLGKYI